jgi:hypothetical protein
VGRTKTWIATGSLVLAACVRPMGTTSGGEASDDADENLDDAHSPDRFGVFDVAGGYIYAEYAQVGDWAMLDGDLAIRTAGQSGGGGIGPRAATVAAPSRLWPGGVVPYVFGAPEECANPDPGVAEIIPVHEHVKMRARNAMEMWEESVIRFVARSDERDYLVICQWAGKNNSTSSFVGRAGGAQYVWTRQGAGTGGIAHELGHVIGLYHEQSRMDRDRHVRIHFECVIEGKAGNFETYAGRGGRDLGPYDYASIMHYGRKGKFSTGCDTIEPIHEGLAIYPEIGQRRGPSELDIRAVNILYSGGGEQNVFPTSYDDGVVVFAEPQRKGRFQVLSAARYLAGDLDLVRADWIQSVSVPAGVVVSLCPDPVFDAGCVKTDHSLDSLGAVGRRVERVTLQRAVAVYSDMELTGEYASFVVGAALREPRRAGSVLVPPGLRATLCAAGNCTPYTATSRDTGLGTIDSIEVAPAATLFAFAGYAGTPATVGPGTYTVEELGVGGDVLSVIAGPGITVELCNAGTCETFRGDVASTTIDAGAAQRVTVRADTSGPSTPPPPVDDPPPVEPDIPLDDGPIRSVCDRKPRLCDEREPL